LVKHERTLNLNGTWDFAPGHLKCENVCNYIFDTPDTEWHEIEVPYFWNGSRWMSVVGDYFYKNGYYKDGQIPPFKDHKGIGWYRRRIRLPAEWRGKRIHLRFLAVAAKAKVWVNGREVGEHLGAYGAFAFDVTGCIDYDGENAIVVEVWGKHCFYPDDQRSFDRGGIHMLVPGRSLDLPVGETRDNAGIGQPVELYATEQAYLSELDVTTTTDSLRLKAHIIREYVEPRTVSLRVRLIEKKTGRLVREEIKATRLPEDCTVLTYVWKSLQVQAWSPETPNLYRLEAELEHQGTGWGVAHKDIGFKTFAIVDKKFYLNGQPYFLRGAGSPVSPIIVHDEEYIAKFLGLCKQSNLNCIRYHTEPPSQAWMQGCDELGLLAIFEGPLMQQAPEIVSTRREFRELVRQAKHHPCLAIYCLSNETEYFAEMGKMTGYDSIAVYLNDLRAAVMQEDDTLPIYHDAGHSCAGEDGDVRDWHIYGGWYDNAIYSYEAIVKGQAMMEALSPRQGEPMAPGGLADRRNMKFRHDMHKPVILTEYLAAYTADDGHLFQYPLKVRRIGKYPDEDHRRSLWFQAFLLRETTEILRRSRDDVNAISGLSPFALFNWFFHPLDKAKLSPKPAALALRDVMEPAHASIKCWHRHAFGGDRLPVEVYLINDDVVRGAVSHSELTYSLKDAGGQVLVEGRIPLASVEYYGVKAVPLPIELPAIPGEHITEATLAVCWQTDGEVLSKNTMGMLLAPSSLREPVFAPGTAKAHVFDVEGATIPLLEKMGLSCLPVRRIAPESGGSTIIIGLNCLERLTPEDKAELNARARQGATVLVLEQDVYHPDRHDLAIDWVDATPLRIMREEDHIDDFVYVPDFSSPIFRGLQPEHFRMWNGNTVVVSSYIRQGTEENHVPAKTIFGSRSGYGVKKLGHVRSHVECFNFLRNDGLIEVPLGQGRVIFNQLEACRRHGDDPAATVYLNNLLRYVIGEGI